MNIYKHCSGNNVVSTGSYKLMHYCFYSKFSAITKRSPSITTVELEVRLLNFRCWRR